MQNKHNKNPSCDPFPSVNRGSNDQKIASDAATTMVRKSIPKELVSPQEPEL